MNTVQHKKQSVTRHELRMNGPITCRDIHDFIVQVDQQYKSITGHHPRSDDAYMVVGDEDGISAVFEQKVRLG